MADPIEIIAQAIGPYLALTDDGQTHIVAGRIIAAIEATGCQILPREPTEAMWTKGREPILARYSVKPKWTLGQHMEATGHEGWGATAALAGRFGPKINSFTVRTAQVKTMTSETLTQVMPIASKKWIQASGSAPITHITAQMKAQMA